MLTKIEHIYMFEHMNPSLFEHFGDPGKPSVASLISAEVP
jgi:hypothetical protein